MNSVNNPTNRHNLTIANHTIQKYFQHVSHDAKSCKTNEPTPHNRNPYSSLQTLRTSKFLQ